MCELIKSGVAGSISSFNKRSLSEEKPWRGFRFVEGCALCLGHIKAGDSGNGTKLPEVQKCRGGIEGFPVLPVCQGMENVKSIAQNISFIGQNTGRAQSQRRGRMRRRMERETEVRKAWYKRRSPKIRKVRVQGKNLLE